MSFFPASTAWSWSRPPHRFHRRRTRRRRPGPAGARRRPPGHRGRDGPGSPGQPTAPADRSRPAPSRCRDHARRRTGSGRPRRQTPSRSVPVRLPAREARWRTGAGWARGLSSL